MYILSGKFKGCKIVAPKGNNTRPTCSKLRATVFNICQTFIQGVHFLDLFAGSGSMGLEALSRGAATATFVDDHFESIKSIKKNIDLLSLQNQTTVYCSDVSKALNRFASSDKKFDLIYVDPPYGEGIGEETLLLIDRLDLLNPGGRLFIEEEKNSLRQNLDLVNLTLENGRPSGRAILNSYRKKEHG